MKGNFYKGMIFGCLSLFSICTFAAGKITGYRGQVFYFTDNPVDVNDSYKYYKDGILYVQDGKILESGEYSTLSGKYGHEATIVDYSGKLITPGFIDAHVHYAQMEMVASYGDQLVDWLEKYTIPTERKFSDVKYASKIANLFIEQLINNGTTTAQVFATIAPVSVDVLFDAAQKRNMRIIAGSAFMDTNTPSYASITPEQAYKDNKALIEKWNNKGRLNYSVTPRSAYLLSEAEIAVATRLVKEYPGIHVQTHLAENKESVDMVRKMFPGKGDYLGVYDYYGLVTGHSTFAHSVWIDDKDFALLAKKGAAAVFCPTSNLFLGSGLFNIGLANKYHVKVALGTDYAAGTSLSIPQTMNEAYKVTQLRKAFSDNPDTVKPLNPFENFYIATLGGARALGLDQYIGSFLPGKEADFVVLDLQSTPVLALRESRSKTLQDTLFAIEIVADDRTVAHTYIMGKRLK
ncbi:MAG: guanine deaminase [Legionellaceae bacterium]|nr:guanine deaminase [Legionellaceae bacterium]